MGMFAPRLPLLLAALFALVACKSTPVPDLALNEDLYAPSGYACKLPGDRTAFIVPVADSRDLVVVADASEGKYPVQYDTDARWHRPLAEMVDDVLRTEIEESEIFGEVIESPMAAQIIVTPTIVAFRTGAVEELAGGRAIAEVSIRFQVHGPADASGARAMILDQTVTDRKVTEAAFRTASRYVLAGISLRACNLRMLQVLDSKNIGRAGMPLPELPAAPTATSR